MSNRLLGLSDNPPPHTHTHTHLKSKRKLLIKNSLFISFYYQNLLQGEPGEFVGQIVKNHPVRDFDGYADKAATRKKILKDVWKKGDECFRSGDILIMDEFGWLYFKDRSGKNTKIINWF